MYDPYYYPKRYYDDYDYYRTRYGSRYYDSYYRYPYRSSYYYRDRWIHNGLEDTIRGVSTVYGGLTSSHSSTPTLSSNPILSDRAYSGPMLRCVQQQQQQLI